MIQPSSPVPEGMVLVPAGEFVMGTPREETMMENEIDNLEDAHPQRRIHLDAFLIGVHPVTNREYRDFVMQTGYPVPFRAFKVWERDWLANSPCNWDMDERAYPEGWDDLPVVLVSWYDALAYCEWSGKRLPTEAEWEKAARGVDGRPFPWGWQNETAGYCNCDVAQRAAGTGPEGLRSVYAYPSGRSPYGCYDMLGNVDEWCADWYASDYYEVMPAINPTGPQRSTACKVQRGVDRFWPTPHVALRSQELPWERDIGTGFRCAMSLDVLNCRGHGKDVMGRDGRRWCLRCGRPA